MEVAYKDQTYQGSVAQQNSEMAKSYLRHSLIHLHQRCFHQVAAETIIQDFDIYSL